MSPQLPKDVWGIILQDSFLSAHDGVLMALVCQSFREIMHRPLTWMRFIRAEHEASIKFLEKTHSDVKCTLRPQPSLEIIVADMLKEMSLVEVIQCFACVLKDGTSNPRPPWNPNAVLKKRRYEGGCYRWTYSSSRGFTLSRGMYNHERVSKVRSWTSNSFQSDSQLFEFFSDCVVKVHQHVEEIWIDGEAEPTIVKYRGKGIGIEINDKVFIDAVSGVSEKGIKVWFLNNEGLVFLRNGKYSQVAVLEQRRNIFDSKFGKFVILKNGEEIHLTGYYLDYGDVVESLVPGQEGFSLMAHLKKSQGMRIAD